MFRKKLPRDPAEIKFLTFLDQYSQKQRGIGRAQTQPNLLPLNEKKTCRSLTSPASFPVQRPKSGKSRPPIPLPIPTLKRPESAVNRRDSPKAAAIRERVFSRIVTGMHVAFLGAKLSQTPGEAKLAEPIAQASVQAVQRIYRYFLKLKVIESDKAAEVRHRRQVKLLQEAWGEESESFGQRGEDVAMSWGMRRSSSLIPRLQWTTFFGWLEQEASCGIQPSYRRTLAALLRGVRLWKDMCATPQQNSEGISLGLMLSWAFPSSSHTDVAQMLSWLGQHHLDTCFFNFFHQKFQVDVLVISCNRMG